MLRYLLFKQLQRPAEDRSRALPCLFAAVVALLLPRPPIAGDSLTICAALAEGIPGRVVQELLSLCGISPAHAAAAAAGQAVEVPLLSRLVAAEGATGRYPGTQAFLRLLTTLVSGALQPDAVIDMLVCALL